MEKEELLEEIERIVVRQDRFGIVEISHYLQRDIDLLRDIWKCVTPIHSIYDNTIHQQPIHKFLCYCDKFEEVERGVQYPTYTITLKRDENNELLDFEVQLKTY